MPVVGAWSKRREGFDRKPQRQHYVDTGADWDPETAPECELCGADYNPKRAEIGHKTCLDCGTPRVVHEFVPTHKGGYVPLTPGMDLKGLYNDKRAD